jgi:hypothetical protein
LGKLQGKVKAQVQKWMSGSDIVKKSNAVDHLKSNAHATAVKRLREKRSSTQTEGQKIAAATSTSEKTIVEHVRVLSLAQKSQLIKKFQLVHFLAVNNKPLNFYQQLVRFDKDVYKVDLGTGYLNNNAAQKILLYLSKSVVAEHITEPLNNGERLYFSILFDGSSSAKTMDEKEVYVIKTCDQGKPRFDVLALQQPEDADAKGLKSSLDCAIDKAKLTVDRKSREIGLGSDGTNTNKALYRLEMEEIGDHLILVLCVSHKLELAIHDAFKKSKLYDAAEEQLVVTYYLFKRANLKWRLFKRHALLMKKSSRRYKRPFGARWVAHQSDALEAFLHNIDLLLGYLNNQIADPYNTTMKKETPRLEGVLASCSDTITLIFQCVKVDLLKLIRPTSLVLESVSILLPEAITTIGVTLKKVKKLMRKLNENGVDALRDESLFPTLKNEFLPSLDFDEEGISLGRSTRKDPSYTGVTTFAGYTLNRGNLENALSKVYDDVMLVLPALELALDERLSFLANDPILSSAAVLLETTAYQNRDEEDLVQPCEVLAEHFRQSLEANGYVKQRLCEFPFVHFIIFF